MSPVEMCISYICLYLFVSIIQYFVLLLHVTYFYFTLSEQDIEEILWCLCCFVVAELKFVLMSVVTFSQD